MVGAGHDHLADHFKLLDSMKCIGKNVMPLFYAALYINRLEPTKIAIPGVAQQKLQMMTKETGLCHVMLSSYCCMENSTFS